MMKKLAALLLSLWMLCTLATAETVDYSGIWYLVSVESNGIAFSPADIGMEMTMNLNADGTGLVSSSGEDDKAATWVLDGGTLTITADEKAIAFTPTADGQLVAESEGTKMIFGREAAAPSYIPAMETAAADIAAFDGTWNATIVNVYGMYLPFSAMAQSGIMDGTVVIQNGSVTALGVTEAEPGTLIDGKLVVTSAVDALQNKTFALLEDGALAMTYMEIVFYCEKVEAAQ